MRYAEGLVVGTFAPLHRGHQLVIETARAACDHVTVMTWAHPDLPAMPTAVRAGWVRELYPDVEVVAFDADCPPDSAPGAVQRAFTAAHVPRPVDAVFTSEPYGDALAAALGAVHVAVDPERQRVPVSGTQIRADLPGHLDQLDPVVRAHFVQKVVFLGAESTGKSTLVDALGAALAEPTVEEVGRTLWVAAGGDLPAGRLRHDLPRARRAGGAGRTPGPALRVRGHQRDHDPAVRLLLSSASARPRSAPTPTAAASATRTRSSARPDVPFDQDGTRVHPQVQQYQDGAIRNDLTVRGIPYTVVGGTVAERVATVRRVIGA